MASFSTIGAAWLAHNAITEYLDRADAAFVRLNLLLLLFVSFLPFPTRLVAEYIHQDKAERVAVTFYGIVLLLSSTMLLVLWRYAVRAHLVRPDTADEEIELLTERLTPGLSAYVVLIVSGLFFPVIAVIGFLGIALYYIIPFRRLSASILPQAPAQEAGRREPGSSGAPVDGLHPDRAQGVQRQVVVERHVLLAALAEPDVAEVLQHGRQRRGRHDRIDARAVAVRLRLPDAVAIRVMASPRSSSQRSRKRPSTIAAWKMPISSPRRLA